MSVPLLELRGIDRVFDTGASRVHALDAVDLAIGRGEFVAIVGPSGSGKSTLMNILGCLDRADAGSYRVAGTEVGTLSADQLADLRCHMFGFVFQRYNLLATADALENVEIPAIYGGGTRAERIARAEALLARLGLADRTRHRPSELSGGQQQRVSVARALMNDAPVILADEPTGALDSRSGEEVLALLQNLNDEGRTILLITHDPAIAARAGRVIRMLDGRVVEDCSCGTRERKDDPSPPAPLSGGHPLGAITGEAIKIALRSLRVNVFRTALTLLGVIIGVASVVTMLAIGDGSKAQILDRISAMGTNLVVIRPGGPGVRVAGDHATLAPADAEALASVPNVDGVVGERGADQTLRHGSIDHRARVTGVTPDFPWVRDWGLSRGSFFSAEDVRGYAPVIILGETVARNLFPDAGDPVGQYVLVRNVPFEVIGVLEPRGASPWGSDQDDVALVPLSTGFMRLFGRPYLHSITVRVADAALIDQTQIALADVLRERHQAEDFQIRNTAAILETAMETQKTLAVLLGSVAAISLLVGGIGVMNIMLVSVTERTREIGIRMAAGARPGAILLQFNIEALVVCAAGGVLGVVLGLVAAMGVERLGLSVAYSMAPPLLAFGCATLTGLVFGILPARKAARMDPVAALAAE